MTKPKPKPLSREQVLDAAMRRYDTPKERAARAVAKQRALRAAHRREARKELAREIELEAERLGAAYAATRGFTN